LLLLLINEVRGLREIIKRIVSTVTIAFLRAIK